MVAFPMDRPFDWRELVRYGPGQINSRLLWEGQEGYATLYAMDAGESISRETALQHRLISVLEGALILTLQETSERLREGESRAIPAGAVYGLKCREKCKFMLAGLPTGEPGPTAASRL